MTTTSWALIGAAVMHLVLTPNGALAQDGGIKLEQDLTWQEVRAKAKQENKFIFLTWPAPRCPDCEAWSRDLYSQHQVGQFFNAKFLSVILPVDSAAGGDSAYTASWTAAQRALREEYRLPAAPRSRRPALLFFSPEGRLVHRAWGPRDAAGLLSVASDALTPSRQYYTLLARHRAGRRDLSVMPSLARTAQSLGDRDVAATVAEDYLKRLDGRALMTKDNIRFMAEFTARSRSHGFRVFRRDAARINQVMDSAGYAEQRIDAIITREEVAPRIKSVFVAPTPDWESITRAITRKYGAATAQRVVAEAQRRRAEDLRAIEGPRLHVGQLNGLAWDVFLESTDPEELRITAEWMKRGLDQEGRAIPGHIIDTYANLLYKMGRVAEAIAWQEKAVAAGSLVPGMLEDTLEKMKKGEPTWPQP